MKSKKSAPAKPAPKKSAFWDEEDEQPQTPAPAPQPPAAPKQPPSKPAKNVPSAPPPPSAIPIEDSSIVFCGDHPVLILSGLNSTWTDLMCWHLEAASCRHLLRADLTPRDAVDRTIAFLQKHIKIQAKASK